MPSFALGRRDPWWGLEGKAARRSRRWHRLVSLMAFASSVAAIGGAGTLWAMQIGLAAMLGLRVPFHIG